MPKFVAEVSYIFEVECDSLYVAKHTALHTFFNLIDIDENKFKVVIHNTKVKNEKPSLQM